MLGHKIMHPHDQHILVVRPIKDRDPAKSRCMRMHPPQKIVVAFLRRRLLETDDVDPLRVHSTYDMPASPVLSRSINPLKNNQQTVTTIGVELSLQIGNAIQVVL